MKNALVTFFQYTLFFIIISCILAGDLSASTLILCSVVSSLSSLLVLVVFKVPTKIHLNIVKVCMFICIVIFSIYSSTAKTLLCFIKKRGRIPTTIEKLPLATKSGVYRLFICQAITLTPGTVSVKSKAGSVSVLKIKTESLDSAKTFDTLLRSKA